MSKNPNPTVRDVARAAKVSASTVSRVLHGARHVKPELARSVVLAARRLGYRLNPFVSELMMRRRSSRAGAAAGPVIAWIEPFADPAEALAHAVQRRFLEGGQRRAEELGCRLERFQSRARGLTPARLTGVLRARGIEGVILLPQPLHLAPQDPCDLRFFASVSLGRASDARRLHTVASHAADAMMLACRELHARGRRRIACMLPHFVERLTGFQFAAGYFAATAAELRIASLPILYGYGLEGGASAAWGAAEHLLARDPKPPYNFSAWIRETRPDAVVSTHLEALETMRAAGLRVPEELAFVHLSREPDDLAVAGVDQALDRVAAGAVDMVIAQLTRNERGVPTTPKTMLIPGTWRDGATA